MKIYHVEHTDYEQSYIRASYTTQEEAQRHAETDKVNLIVVEGRLFDSFDKYEKSQ